MSNTITAVKVSQVYCPNFLTLKTEVCADLISTFFIRKSVKCSAELVDGFVFDFYALSNDGFFLAPQQPEILTLMLPGQVDIELSAEVFGIIMTLFALCKYSRIEHAMTVRLATLIESKYQQLYSYAVEHPKGGVILRSLAKPYKRK